MARTKWLALILTLAALAVHLASLAEHYRLVSNEVEVRWLDERGKVVAASQQKNLRTTAGNDVYSNLLFASGSAQPLYIALSADTTVPAVGDTSLASEITTNGLGRTAASVSHSTGTTTTTLSASWTWTGSGSLTVDKIGMFNASSSGTLVHEAFLAAPYPLLYSSASWASSHGYSLNTLIYDGAYVEEVTTAGTSGSSAPTWNLALNGTTTDGGVTWTNLGPRITAIQVNYVVNF
jgi:hypothetical protein